MKLQGIFAPLATPFDHKGEIYPAKVQHNVEKWNRVALAGYVMAGLTGEGALLTSEEIILLWELTAKYAAPEKLLIAGAGAESVHGTVLLINRAAEIGYKAALVTPPYSYHAFLRCPEAQAIFFRAVADRSKIPVVIHNCPAEIGVDLSDELLAELSFHPNIIGVCEGSGSVEKLARVIARARPGFQVLTGEASVLWESLQSGASGAVLALSNAAPYATIAIWEAHRTREEAPGLDWQARIRLASELVTRRHGIPGLKHAMDLNGYYGGPPRLPLCVLLPKARRAIEEAFRDLKG